MKSIDETIDNIWMHKVSKPFDKDCNYDEYIGVRRFMILLKKEIQ